MKLSPGDVEAMQLRKSKWASLRDLEVFFTVMQERKAILAAERLGISQPAVSRTLAQMEEKSGRKLFRREGHGIAPTADALVLHEKLLQVFQQLNDLEDFPIANEGATTLRLACPPTLAHCFIEATAARFLKLHPEIRLNLDIVTTPEVLALVGEQRVDLGMADVLSSQAGIVRTVYRRSAMVCVLQKAHKLASRKRIRLSDLQGQPLILLARRNPMRSTIERLLEKGDVQASVKVDTATALSAVNFAAHGLGIALVNPFPVINQLPARMVALPFEPALEFESCFYTPSDRQPTLAAQKFMEFVRTHHSQPAP